MTQETCLLHGFDKIAAKKSLWINTVFIKTIAKVEGQIKAYTSTPVSKSRKSGSRMEMSFSKYYEDAMKSNSHLHLMMDHDSGYISHHHESNSDSSSENIGEAISHSRIVSKPIFLSEDALLEKPEINIKQLDLSAEIDKEDFEETRRLFYSPESIVNNSVTSVETNFSGLENESSSLSDCSDTIPQVKPIIIKRSDINTYLVVSKDELHQTSSLNNKLDLSVDSNPEYSDDNNVTHESHSNLIATDIIEQNNLVGVNETSIILNDSKSDVFVSDIEFDPATETKEGSIQQPETEQMSFSNIMAPGIDIKNQESKIFDPASLEIDKPAPVTVKNPETIGSNNFIEQSKPIPNVTSLSVYKSGFNNNKNKDIVSIKSMCSNKTPKKQFKNDVDSNCSPDLFSDDEQVEVVKEKPTTQHVIAEEKYVISKDHRILKRVQNGLNGIFPPPSVTFVQMSVNEMLNKLESNRNYMWSKDICEDEKMDVDTSGTQPTVLNNSTESMVDEFKSLLVTTRSVSEIQDRLWPSIMEERYHGLHYNRSKLSEEFEHLCDKYAKRYVGSETSSSCTVFENSFVSPSKRKSIKPKWGPAKSPGRRLSHLARRRITFSSANLQAGTSLAGSRARQILVDAKKLDLLHRRKSPRSSPRKTPKKTPGKSPRRKNRTPSSSAKKKLAMRFRKLTGEIEKTVPSTSSESKVVLSSKRALFQSPSRDNHTSSLTKPSTSGLSSYGSESKKVPPKRALFLSPHKNSPKKFSPYKKSPFKHGFEKKRKRSESDENHPAKLPRSMSMTLDLRSTESETKQSKSRFDLNITRPSSASSGELSAVHKKKLQWAVYEALQSQNITPTHNQFKLFASILARVTRRFLPNLSNNGPRPEGSTSERMLRIARHHVYAVVKGKSVDEIINEYIKNRSKHLKPQGYVGIEEFNNLKNRESSMKHEKNVLQDRINTIESIEKAKLEQLSMKSKTNNSESKVDRIRKVINFGDDR